LQGINIFLDFVTIPFYFHIVMNTIWLCSWYPNSEDEFTGDFIQRQALAVSAFACIDVLHVVFCKRFENVISQINHNLTEHIYYRPKGHHLANFSAYVQAHYSFYKAYCKSKGKPALIHVQVPFKAGIAAVCLKYLYKIPYVVTEHYGIYNSLLDDAYASRSWWFRFFTRQVIVNADRLTTVSYSLGEDMNALVTKKSYTVISNVVDTSLFKYSAPPPADHFYFIHISNMIPLKNTRGIIEAAAELKKKRSDFSVILVGNVNEEYLELARQKQLLDTVIFFKGILPYEQIAEQIAAAHALIIFSDTESQSCVVLEALCSGRPAIVTNTGGVKELIHDENGFKVNVRDSAELAMKMDTLMTNYGDFDKQKIADAAASQYSYEAVGRQFFELYLKVNS